MTINRSRVFNLMQGIQFKDPKLFEVLRELVLSLEAQSNPVDDSTRLTDLESTVLPNPVTTFSYRFTKRNLILEWANPDVGTVKFFDLREGTVWDTADSLLITGTTKAVLDPVTIGVTHTFLLRSIDLNGVYSATEAQVDVVVPPIGAFGVTVSVIDNNVLLIWTEPTSTFQLSHYIIKKDGTQVGITTGTFIAIFENASGTYTYSIVPVDIVGNEGTKISIDAEVNQPPDFELQDSELDDLSGTLTNLLLENDRLLGPVFDSETWAGHFTKGPWDDIAEIIAAGYSIWIQPAESTAEYERTFDFGAIVDNTLINVTWATQLISGSVGISLSVEYSDDAVSWSTPVVATSVFAVSLRYVRLTFTFTPTDDTGLIELFNILVTLSLKREMDSGDDIADETDTNGTVVLFNKTFKDIDSITLTVDSIEPVTAIYDFTDAPNPTQFSVYIYDNRGARITYPFSWKARGVV